ncbi:putative RNase-like toxin [Rhodococcus sp. AG1013]|nr:putative RNase-like toxin [Rhodococcus sp. AG1013]
MPSLPTLAVQRVPSSYDAKEQKKLIGEGIRDKDIGKIKSIDDSAFVHADDTQCIDMILILLNQGWVGPRDENAMYSIWKSRGRAVIALASKYAYVWNMCLQRGVTTIWDIPDLTPVKHEFKQAVSTKARSYLDINKKTVETERKRYGLDSPSTAPTSDQGRAREDLMVAAGTIKKAKAAVAALDGMPIGFDGPVNRDPRGRSEKCVGPFDPANPPALESGSICRPASPSQNLPTWNETKKNYDRVQAIVDHFAKLYPALVALRDDTQLDAVAKLGVSSELPAEQLSAMNVIDQALANTKDNIDQTYPLLTDAKVEFALELQPIHQQLFREDPNWKEPFRKLIAERAIEEHNNVQFWNTMGVAAAGMALIVVAEITTGGLATFFLAAAAAGSSAQAAASWDKYLTLKAASESHLSEETNLVRRDQVSAQLIEATLDTVMAFLDVYSAVRGGATALAKSQAAEARFGELLGKEARVVAAQAKSAKVELAAGHEIVTTERGIERCSTEPCPLIGAFWENTLERNPQVRLRLDDAAAKARTDPVYAVRNAASADMSLQSITEFELEQWAATLPQMVTRERAKFTDLKRLPEHRADLANKPLTPADIDTINRNIAEMKADGRLPQHYVYTPPSAPGAVIPRDVYTRASEIIGTRLSDDSAVAACWRAAAEHALKGEKLTADNYAPVYKSAQKKFWELIGADEHAAAKKFFTDRGFIVNGKRSAYLNVEGLHSQEISVGLDHMLPKASDDNWVHALNPEQLQTLIQADNTKLSHLEKSNPSLRR